MHNATVTILNTRTGELEIEVAHGLPAEARRRGRYQLGEGITGKVVASGEPIIVPAIGEEPMFLNRTRSRGDEDKQRQSFLCVPLRVGQEVIGALSVDREYPQGLDRQCDEDLQFLTVVGGLIAQTAKRIQMVNEERESLLQENSKLRRELSGRTRVEGIVGTSSRMQEVFDMVHRVAPTPATVLLRGESGTGKTMVAKAIHANSPERLSPLWWLTALLCLRPCWRSGTPLVHAKGGAL